MTRQRYLQFTRSADRDNLLGLATVGTKRLDLSDEVETFGDLSKHDVLAVEPAGDDGGDEELGAVGVGAGVGHRQEPRLGVLQLEVLISKLLAVDGFATSAVSFRKVATLQHELRDDAVEAGAGITESVLSRAEFPEVTGCLGDLVVKEVEDDATRRRPSDGNVEIDVRHLRFEVG